MIGCCIVIVSLILVYFSKYLYRSWVNPLSLFLIIWGTILGILGLNLRSGISLENSSAALPIIILGGASYLIAVMISLIISPLKKNSKEIKVGEKKKDKLNLQFINFIIRISLFFAILKIFEIFLRYHQLGLPLESIIFSPQTVYTMQTVVFQAKGLSLLSGIFSVLAQLHILGIIAVTYKIRKGLKTNILLLFILLSPNIISGIVFNNRYHLVITVLIFMLTLIFTAPDYKKINKKSVIVVATILLLMLISPLIYISGSRRGVSDISSAMKEFLEFLYKYFVYPVPGFSQAISEGRFTHFYFGASTLRSVSKWLIKFNILPENLLIPGHREYVLIPGVYTRGSINVFTWYVNFFEDFGFIGILLIPFLIGLIYSFFFINLKRSYSFFRLVMVVILSATVTYSFFGFLLGETTFIVLILAAFILERLYFAYKVKKIKIIYRA